VIRALSLSAAAPGSLGQLRHRARECQACPLWRDATQTVFGEGEAGSRLVLVGEQPGDLEDLAGRPFVGPAGLLLDRALAAAGIPRDAVYVTNAVKHFKWIPRGKRRIHKTPAQREIEACQQWLAGEVEAIAPVLLVCLGATAARAVLGGAPRVNEWRGRIIPTDAGPRILVTIHPAAALRALPAARESAYESLVDDLGVAAQFVFGR
jgi:DNA polymerase